MKKTTKTVLIGADHAGFELKKKLVAYMKEMPKEMRPDVEDMGAHTLAPDDDYPAILAPLAMRIATDAASGVEPKLVGIIIGGSGNGEAMVCNRFPGIRAAVYYGGGYMQNEVEDVAPGHAGKSSLDIVRLAREHNDANVLSLGARFVSDDEAYTAVRIFIETAFSGEERHARRIAQIDEIE